MKFSLSSKASKAMTKVVMHSETDKVVGIHMVGESASEILQVSKYGIAEGAYITIA